MKKHNEELPPSLISALAMDLGTPDLLSKFQPIIRIRGEVDDVMANSFQEAVDELKYNRKLDVAIVEIASEGGSVTACNEILSCMSGSGLHFVTYCSSYAYSAAAAILSHGDKGMRFMSPYADAMIHGFVTSTGMAPVEEQVSEIHFHEVLNDRFLSRIAKNCGISLKKLKDQIKKTGSRNLWLTPEDALNIGLVDHIGIPSLEIKSTYEINGYK